MNDSASPSDKPGSGRLLENLMHFGRTLRAAGLPIGPGKVLAATEAVQAVGITNRNDFYWALHAVFVNRRDQRELFDQAFHIFWRNPQLLEKMMGLLLPEMRSPDAPQGEKMSRRLAEALHSGQSDAPDERHAVVEIVPIIVRIPGNAGRERPPGLQLGNYRELPVSQQRAGKAV